MRSSRLAFVAGLVLLASSFSTTAFALSVDPGGPWRCAEGSTLTLQVTVFDSVGNVEYAWDLDGDGVFDDGGESTAEFSALGVDGPSEGFTVGLVVADDVDQTLVQIPVDVTNAPPVFTNPAETRAVIGRQWTWAPVVTDPGNDPIDPLTVATEDMPPGMLWDALLQTFTWVPNEGHLLQGEPPGTYSFRVTAQDEDRGRTNYDVTLTVVRNNPPPVPPIVYPGAEVVRTAQPTIILSNVDDPDGDELHYFLQVDSDPCFCSAEAQESEPLVEGDFATQWRLPQPLLVRPGDPLKRYYVQRWTSDGIQDSAKELSLFDLELSEDGGDGDADSDADTDADSDVDGDVDGDDDTGGGRGGCGVTPTLPSSAPWAALAALAGALALSRRRRG